MTQKPVHTIQLSKIRAAIWANESDKGTWYNVTVTRTYRDSEDKPQDSTTFGRDDLLLVAKAADQAHSWILSQPRG